jgi:hypothetical protein
MEDGIGKMEDVIKTESALGIAEETPEPLLSAARSCNEEPAR